LAKIIFSDLNSKGFSLLELVIVISVLTILSSIGISSYICVQKRAKATAALVALKQIQKECSNNIEIGDNNFFKDKSLNGYSIQPQNNSCSGVGDEGLISIISDDENTYPSFIYSAKSKTLIYRYQNQTGENIADGLDLICNKNFVANVIAKKMSYPEEIDNVNYCISHGKITGGTKVLCGADAQHASEKHAHWHCEEAEANGDWRHVIECNQVKKDYGCEWNSEKGQFNLSEDGKTCAELINETACQPNWTRRVVCLRFGIWPSAYRACLRQTSGCSDDYKDPRW
tara:strand:- start:370 stop:1227 length:858 start_codon:yes stop_codon:yes gene_type:complete